MTFAEAIQVLNLQAHQAGLRSAIARAWKLMMIRVHPDKCGCEDATAKAQRLNEARDFLLGRFIQAVKTPGGGGVQRRRRRRNPEGRKHVKTEESKEGVELMREMRCFFRDGFRAAPAVGGASRSRNRVLTSEVLGRFEEARGELSVSERNLFRRHCRRIFLGMWPGAVYSVYRDKRCFLDVEAAGILGNE